MTKLSEVTAFFGAMAIVLALVLTSFQIAIYGDSEYRFYQKEYEKYNVADDLQMEMKDVMHVTGEMMEYLHGNREELSVMTTIDGANKDFFNEQDRFHMGEVKDLFLGGLLLRWILLGVGILLLLVSVVTRCDWRNIIPKAIQYASVVFVGTAVVIGSLCAINFTQVFEVFHQIFFNNDLWIFDPETDYMIRMLPEGFFFDMLVRIGVVFLILLAVLLAAASIWKFFVRRKEDKELYE